MRKIPKNVAVLVLATLALAWLVGCGPVESLVVINQAHLNIEAAERSEAARYAPYEYFSATERMHKAREEMNYSDYEVAIDLALEAKSLAALAREKAVTHPDRTIIPPAGSRSPSDADRLD